MRGNPGHACQQLDAGEETTLFGLPTTGGCASGCKGEISSIVQPTVSGGTASYYAPLGFVGQMDNSWNTGATPFRTFLSFDFTPGVGADAGCFKLPWPAGKNSSPTTIQYGPGSAHAVVMHGMGDGSVQSLAKSIDPAAYMFLITRAGQDPIGLAP